jgi:hypothetical protein
VPTLLGTAKVTAASTAWAMVAQSAAECVTLTMLRSPGQRHVKIQEFGNPYLINLAERVSIYPEIRPRSVLGLGVLTTDATQGRYPILAAILPSLASASPSETL